VNWDTIVTSRSFDAGAVDAMSKDPDAAGGGTGNLRALASVLGAAAAPPALVLALAYYFAVRRQEALALHFGLDTSVLGYSTRDYLLRGGDTFFLLLLFASLTALAAIAGHVALTRHALPSWSPASLRATSLALKVVGAVLLIIGIVAVFEPLPLNVVLGSLSLGVGIVLLAYGIYFEGKARGAGFFHRPGREGPDLLLVATVALIGVVVFLSIFWATKELAQALGRGQARQLERSLSARPGAIVYSERRLYLPGVSESELSGDGYRYRYAGLRLLVRSAGKYLLIPEGWSRASGVVILLNDDDSIRVEFTRGQSR
jgi:hypothetical protein